MIQMIIYCIELYTIEDRSYRDFILNGLNFVKKKSNQQIVAILNMDLTTTIQQLPPLPTHSPFSADATSRANTDLSSASRSVRRTPPCTTTHSAPATTDRAANTDSGTSAPK